MTPRESIPPGGRATVTFSAESFAAAVPFGFVLDANGDVVLVGRALERRLPAPLPRPLEALFEDASTRPFPSIHEGLHRRSPALRLRLVGTQIVLKGEGIDMASGGCVAFLGAPVVQSLDELQDCGLQLRDFTIADSTPDLLMSMQATKTALADARKLGEKLKASVARAEAAVEAKGQFLAVMSHEIRTPMHGLGSMLDLLMASEIDEEQRALCATIDECVTTLGTLVNDVLDLSKLEAGAVEVEMMPVSVPDLLRSVIHLFAAAAEDDGVRLRSATDPSAPTCVLGDPTRIRQVLGNLVSNAIKFSRGGEVTVEVSTTTPGALDFRVVDTGIGIPEAARAHVFDTFSQADSSTTRRFGGTGLGLSIARGLARAMNGDLELESSSGGGSTFLFRLGVPCESGCPVTGEGLFTGPFDLEGDRGGEACRKTAADERIADGDQEEATALPEGLSVLVADDNPVNLRIAERLLKKLGARATSVPGGAEAVDAVCREAFDLILMDMMMPEVDGVEATRQIRQLAVEWSDLPILAFTAGVVPSVREEAEQAGMDDFLQKPMRLDGLREAIARNLGR